MPSGLNWDCGNAGPCFPPQSHVRRYPPLPARMHTRMHTHTHTHMNAHMRAHIRTHTHICVCTHAWPSQAHTHMHTCVCTRTLAHMHTHTHVHVCALTQMHAHTCTQMHTHAYTCACTHKALLQPFSWALHILFPLHFPHPLLSLYVLTQVKTPLKLPLGSLS